MNNIDLKKILADHAAWLNDPNTGRRANLTCAYLANANLTCAYLANANLTGADLRDADLRDANLRDADLRDANLRDANLTGANLRDANLTGADLRDANLTGADLRDANLRGADLRDANLGGADLRGASLPAAPVVPDLDAHILGIVEASLGNLDMEKWHTCETTHCRAGWAVVLAGEEGGALEQRFGTAVAGTLIYHASTGRVPNFYTTTDEALVDLRRGAQA